MHRIVDHGLVLLDQFGNRTTWGFWSPLLLNAAPDPSQRGLNSVQILAWLVSAHRVCEADSGGKKFLAIASQLVEEEGYGLNVLNQKIEKPSEDNFCDDMLGYLSFFTWVWNVQRLPVNMA